MPYIKRLLANWRLMVSIAIFGIMISLLFSIAAVSLVPIFARRGETTAQQTCLNNIRCLGTAIKMFANDNDERYPMVCIPHPSDSTLKKWWMDQIKPYTTSNAIFKCPMDYCLAMSPLAMKPGITTLAGSCSYAYRDYYQYRDITSYKCSSFIPGASEGNHADASITAVLRCSPLNMNVIPPAYNDSLGTASYTNYAGTYGMQTGISPLGTHPVITSSYVPASSLARFSHSEGTCYLYMDGHTAWMSASSAGQSCFKQYALTAGGKADAF